MMHVKVPVVKLKMDLMKKLTLISNRKNVKFYSIDSTNLTDV